MRILILTVKILVFIGCVHTEPGSRLGPAPSNLNRLPANDSVPATARQIGQMVPRNAFPQDRYLLSQIEIPPGSIFEGISVKQPTDPCLAIPVRDPNSEITEERNLHIDFPSMVGKGFGRIHISRQAIEDPETYLPEGWEVSETEKGHAEIRIPPGRLPLLKQKIAIEADPEFKVIYRVVNELFSKDGALQMRITCEPAAG